MPFYPTLNSGQYIFDQEAQVYVHSNADAGKTVSAQLSIKTGNYIVTTELHVIPSTAPYQFHADHGGMQQFTGYNGKGQWENSNSAIFAGDLGCAYYPGGAPLAWTASPASAGQYNGTRPQDNDVSFDGVGGYGLYQFSAADAGKEVVITYQYLNPDFDSYQGQPGMNLALDIRPGVQGQLPSSYMSSPAGHPDQAVGYSLTAIVEADNGYIGVAGVMPNYSYEVMGMGVVGGGVIDADPLACAEMLLTDAIVGVGIPSSIIDGASWFSAGNSADAWIKGNAFYISQAIQNPQGAAGIIGRWFEAFNIAAVYSAGLLKLIPYGDQSVGGYTPNLTICAELTDDDYLASEGEDPVTITRSPWADAWNRVQVTYKNRSNSYNDDLVYEQDEASIERYGLRIKGRDSLDFVTSWQLASAVANMWLKRSVTVRNTYEFRVPTTFEYLEPMDLIAVTDSRLGLSGQVVRITKMVIELPKEGDDSGGIAITCEDFPGNGYAMPVVNPKASTPANHPTQSAATAGGTSAVIVQASNASTSQQGSKLYIWCRGADTPTWAGCAVFYSLDGSNYSQLGIATAPAPIYNLTSSLASVTPSPSGNLALTHDTSSTFTITPATNGNQVVTVAGLSAWSADTSYAAGSQVSWDGQPWVAVQGSTAEVPTASSPFWQQISSATEAAAAVGPQTIGDTAASQLFNLSAVIAQSGGSPSAIEFLSFATVTAASLPSTWTLSDLYRGALNTTPSAFSAGAQMVSFEDASVTWNIPAGLAGQTVYFKFVAWNQGGVSRQTLENVPFVEFVIAGAGGAGVWESLGGIVADVVQTGSGGRGELIVNPAGGVAGNLPYNNHSTTITGVVNNSGQLTNGTTLDTAGSLTLGDWHNRVKNTIAGFSLTGLDNVSDGATYGRGLLARLNAGRPWIDFSESIHANKILDNIGDGGTYGRPLLSRLNTGRPWIDFSEAIHANQTLDHMADGSTYGRPLLSRLSSGLPWVDLSESINLGRHLGNIADDSASSRYGVSSIDTNRRALVDLSQSGHLNRTMAYISDDAGSSRYAVADIDGNRRALIDFTQSGHVSKNIDNLADGATYGRTVLAGLSGGYAAKTGSGSYDIKGVGDANTLSLDSEIADGSTYLRMPGANMDANRRGLVDFTQAGHVGKILDNIGDGSTYGRPLLARLSSGKPWIDFSEAIHANKTLDYMGDGATYFRTTADQRDGGGRGYAAIDSGNIVIAAGLDFARSYTNKHLGNIPDDSGSQRFAVLAIDGNRRAIIDATAAHINWTLDHLPDGGTRFGAVEVNADKTANHIGVPMASNYSTTPAMNSTSTYVQIDSMSVSFTLQNAGAILAIGNIATSGNSTGVNFRWYVDGSPVGAITSYSASDDPMVPVLAITLAAGSHTLAAYSAFGNGTWASRSIQAVALG